MSTLVRQNTAPATETTESTESTETTESTDTTESTESTAASVLPDTWGDGAAMLSDILPLADKLDANDQTKQDRKLACRRVVRRRCYSQGHLQAARSQHPGAAGPCPQEVSLHTAVDPLKRPIPSLRHLNRAAPTVCDQ